MKREDLKIISGGQTGVDRAALDAAIEAGVAHGGWCPAGRRSEDGPIPEKYQLVETLAPGYLTRTTLNVRDADATLILFWEAITGGTARTQAACRTMRKSYYAVNIKNGQSPQLDNLCLGISAVFSQEHLVLNVAGPRASKHPLVYENAKRYVDQLIKLLLA